MLEGVLIDQAIEVLFQRARDFGWSPGAGAVDEPPRPLVRKTVNPFPQGRIGKVQGIGDRLKALPCDDGTHSLGAAEDPCLFGLLDEGV